MFPVTKGILGIFLLILIGYCLCFWLFKPVGKLIRKAWKSFKEDINDEK